MKRRVSIRAVLTPALIGFALLCALAETASAQGRYRAVKDPASPAGIPYTRYFTKDKFDRRITFYVHGDAARQLPIVVSVLGSGAYSNFVRVGDEIQDGHRAAREAFDGLAHVVVVEKPGVQFLEQHGENGEPGGHTAGASLEFLRENSLDRWVEAVSAALKAARTLPLADTRRTLLIGHSEGGIVAAMVAAENDFVTHVASLSGTGPSLLFELMRKAREGRLYYELPTDAETQVAQLLSDVGRVRTDPTSISKTVLGHSHLYWSSRWRVSAMEEFAGTNARVFLAHGSKDRNVSVANFDLLYTQLLAQGKDVTARRYEGADHGYRYAADPKRDGWNEVFEEVRNWVAAAKHPIMHSRK
jgi:predicted esterase